MKNQISYIDKKVFAGIDVHKKSYKICVIMDGKIINRATTPGNPESLGRYLERYKGAEIHTVYEAGFSGYGLHRFLNKLGIKSIIVNPGSIATEKNCRVKTDKHDAARMATDLSQNRLTGIRIPSEDEELARTLTRTRAQLVFNRTSVKNQITMRLFQFGKIDSMDRTVLIPKLKNRLSSFEQELNESISYLIELWDYLNEKVKEITKKLKEQAKDNTAIAIYRSIPGVGLISACVFARELGDLSQFSSQKKLNSFIGLTPSEDSSGETIRRGHITRLGKPFLRAALIQCAWVAISKDSSLKQQYKRISAKAGPKRAIVAMAKKIIGIARALFREQRLYSPAFGEALA